MPITLAELGSLGEFISSVGVVASLVYLSFQIRQNTHNLRASAIQEVNTDSQNLLLTLTDPQLARVMIKVSNNQLLDETEAYIAGNWLSAAMRGWENQYYQYQHGLLGREIYESRLNALIDKVARTEFGRQWWNESGRKIYSKKFLSLVDEVIQKETVEKSSKKF